MHASQSRWIPRERYSNIGNMEETSKYNTVSAFKYRNYTIWIYHEQVVFNINKNWHSEACIVYTWWHEKHLLRFIGGVPPVLKNIDVFLWERIEQCWIEACRMLENLTDANICFSPWRLVVTLFLHPSYTFKLFGLNW